MFSIQIVLLQLYGRLQIFLSVCVYLISVKLLDVIQNDMEESYSDDEGPVMKKSQLIDDLKVKTTKETTTFLYRLLYSRSTWPCWLFCWWPWPSREPRLRLKKAFRFVLVCINRVVKHFLLISSAIKKSKFLFLFTLFPSNFW